MLGPVAQAVVDWLETQTNDENVAGMARYGIRPVRAIGMNAPQLEAKAKQLGTDQGLALELWSTGIHEARMIAVYIADPQKMSGALMDRWAQDFDSWALCDHACMHLFDRTQWAYVKALEWTGWEPEYVKRAGFALAAALAVHDKKADDARFRAFFKPVLLEAGDDRNLVKKGISWALRQIGKRSRALHVEALEVAKKLAESDSAAARWVGKDVLKELESESVKKRIALKP